MLAEKCDQRARENSPENPSIHVAVRTTVLDRKNVNEMINCNNASCELMSTCVM